MESSYLESKIINLQARLKAENEASQRENLMKEVPISTLCSPQHGSGRRPKLREYPITSYSLSLFLSQEVIFTHVKVGQTDTLSMRFSLIQHYTSFCSWRHRYTNKN